MDAIMNTATIAAMNILDKQAITANNLANVSTTGFKQQFNIHLLLPVHKSIKQKNHNMSTAFYNHMYSDLSCGPILHTKRSLDLFVKGNGWLTVQDKTTKNKESYTKNGHLQINNDRKLTINNHLVLSTNGPINIPKQGNVHISTHGMINILNLDNHNTNSICIGQLKLINLDDQYVEQGSNGLFYLNEHGLRKLKKHVSYDTKISSGNLESSNVNLSENLINMISYEKQFSIVMKLISNDDENIKIANQLLSNN